MTSWDRSFPSTDRRRRQLGPGGTASTGRPPTGAGAGCHRAGRGRRPSPRTSPWSIGSWSKREVIVLDGTTENPLVRRLMDQSGTTASVVAPLFAAGEFLGVIAANFRNDTPADLDPRPRPPRAAVRSGRPGRHRPPEPGAAGEDLAHGLARRAHRTAQPAPVRGPGRAGAGPVPSGRRAGLHVLRRSRPLQVGQRHLRARRRRRSHPAGRVNGWWTPSGARTRWPGWAATSSPSSSPGSPTSCPSTSWPSARSRR